MVRRSFVSITPEQIALLQLRDCAAHLDAAPDDPIQILQAAKSLHLALVAALTAALAGSAGIGAYDPKLKVRWLHFLNSAREPVTEVELSQRVMTFGCLLDRACEKGGIERIDKPLACSLNDRELIDRLSFIRGEFEHPKPMLNSFEPAWVVATFPPAARLTIEALEAVRHHFEEAEMAKAHLLVSGIMSATEHWVD